MTSTDTEFTKPWSPEAVAGLNHAIRMNQTSINSSYAFIEVWFQVPAPSLTGVLTSIRQIAIESIQTKLGPDASARAIGSSTPVDGHGVTIAGSGNQVSIGSAGSHQIAVIGQGDWSALRNQLQAIGYPESAVSTLRAVLEDPNATEEAKTAGALAWAKRGSEEFGLSVAGSVAATLLLQYLGHI